MRKLVTLALFAALSVSAADFTGNWTGTMKLKRPDGVVVEEDTTFLNLKQTGDTVKGKAGRDSGGSSDVLSGKADGDTLTFQIRENAEAPLMNVKLTLQEGELVGQVQAEIDGQKMLADLRFKRK